MERHLEQELNLPVIIAAEHGVKLTCFHCGTEVITMHPVAEGLCETCYRLVHELQIAQAEHGFRFGF